MENDQTKCREIDVRGIGKRLLARRCVNLWQFDQFSEEQQADVICHETAHMYRSMAHELNNLLPPPIRRRDYMNRQLVLEHGCVVLMPTEYQEFIDAYIRVHKTPFIRIEDRQV